MRNLMPTITTPDGVFHDGNPATGVEGTIVTATWTNDVQASVRDAQAEMIAVLAMADMQPNPQKQNQLAEAIRQIIGSGDYVTHPYLKLELLKKIDKADIAQQLGNDPAKVASQQLVTTELGKKAGVADVNGKLAKDQNGADIPDKQKFIDNLGLPGKFQPKDDYVLHSYLKLELLKKIDKADIAQQLGNDPAKVASQQLVTTELGKKAAVGTSYSKAESDNKYQPKGAESSELAIGINQKWTNVSSQRSPGVNYTNGLKKPLMINIYSEWSGNNAPWIKLYVAGALVAHSHVRYDQNLKVAFVTAIVPPGTTYSYQKEGTTVVVMELR
ncbi:TPA: hypothetical protein ACUNBO_002124 [Morganella morganii]